MTTNDYSTFLASKRLTDPPSGLDVPIEALSDVLYPFQRALVRWALRRGRAGLFAHTGLGKGLMLLEWAEHIPGPVLLLAPLAVTHQLVREAAGKFGRPLEYVRHPDQITQRIVVTNYDMIRNFYDHPFTGIVCDESSILKSISSKTREELLTHFTHIPYRLCCTATPAPNDIAEIGNHCLPFHSFIVTREGNREIGDIVKKRDPVEVLSLENGKLVWRHVTNWMKHKNPEGLWRIQWGRCGRGATLLSTPGHPVLTQAGWLPAQEIKPGDEVAVAIPSWSPEQEEIIYATLLGDSWLRVYGKGWPSLISCHAKPQWGYLDWLADALDTKAFDVAMRPGGIIRGRQIHGQPQRRIRTKQSPNLWHILRLAYPEGKKQVTRRWLNKIGPLGLAVWAMDDGTTRTIANTREARLCTCKRGPHRKACLVRGSRETVKGYHFVFHTDGFTLHERDIITTWLKERFNLHATPNKNSKRNVIILTRESTRLLRRIIEPYLRLGDHEKEWLHPLISHEPKECMTWLPVISSCPEPKNTKTGSAYDIEVEGAHNFVMASGLVVHNSEFLGVMKRTDMLSTFFVHDDTGWRLRGHAATAFYRWMASWSMALRAPEDVGFDGAAFRLPPLTIKTHVVQTAYRREGELLPSVGLKGITDRSRVRQGTVDARVAVAADLARQAEGQVVCWCGLNQESTALTNALAEESVVEVSGSQALAVKETRLLGFLDGTTQILISKAKIAGHGLNMQNAHTAIFVGLNDSWETWFQTIRRLWRYGQTQEVTVHLVISDHEQPIFDNIQRKEKQAERMVGNMIEHMHTYEQEALQETASATAAAPNKHYQGPGWDLYHSDCVEGLQEVADDSVGLSVFSPPFLALYQYSPTERDLGNSQNAATFFSHFHYVADELLRVTTPGRHVAMHVSQVPAMLIRDGWIGLKDFRGEMTRHMVDWGWVYHGEVVIWKNPQAQAIRIHAKGLAFGQLRKDASWMRPALADYVLLFRKPGENPAPILPELTNDEWIQWASPVWMDIRETDTLNAAEAREDADDRHICPLQLGVIERCIRLWSNPGETILDPFSGIGSTGFVALQQDRRFVGCELKGSYVATAMKNLELATTLQRQQRLF